MLKLDNAVAGRPRVAMKWFAKRKPSDIWDEPIQWPVGDIEAADRIRNICQSASASAERVGGIAARAGHGRRSAEKQRKHDSERYERAARAAMEIAMKISDELMRDDAVRRIVDLCMKANDMKTAQILSRDPGELDSGGRAKGPSRARPVMALI